MVAYDNNKYWRCLPDFCAMLTALPVDQIAFLHIDFTWSIIGNPDSHLAQDMWIECIVNKGSTMKSGWLSISRMRNNCWCTPEMWAMWPGSGRFTTSWPIEKMPRGSTWNVAQNGCETMSSACRTWSYACMSLIPSRSTRPHPPSAPYSQPCLHLVSSLQTSTHLVLRARKNLPISSESGCSVYSTKDDERDLRVQGKAQVPNTYMKLADLSPCQSVQNAAV